MACAGIFGPFSLRKGAKVFLRIDSQAYTKLANLCIQYCSNNEPNRGFGPKVRIIPFGFKYFGNMPLDYVILILSWTYREMFEFICFDVLFVRVVDTVVPLVDMGVPGDHTRKKKLKWRTCLGTRDKTGTCMRAWRGSTRLSSALRGREVQDCCRLCMHRGGLRARGAIARRARARGAS